MASMIVGVRTAGRTTFDTNHHLQVASKDLFAKTNTLFFSFIHSFASCTVTHGQGKPMALLTWQKTKGVNFRAPLSGVTE